MTRPSTTKMSKEMRHQPDLKPFVGQWVVLLNDAVIEHGEELASIVERARARGIRCPRVLFVEPQQKRVVMLGL